ncbi:MAG: hypothetical protein GY845_30275 [Planctomycetes bacterium]|nr:hypothetical protein [Planctomycetota bacterium]
MGTLRGNKETSGTGSIWWMKGDTGIISHLASFRLHIEEWVENDRVTFSMKGISESMTGKGALRLEAEEDDTKLNFYLEIKAGGLIGPMVNAVIGPVLRPIAEDFAVKLKMRIEELQPRAA